MTDDGMIQKIAEAIYNDDRIKSAIRVRMETELGMPVESVAREDEVLSCVNHANRNAEKMASALAGRIASLENRNYVEDRDSAKGIPERRSYDDSGDPDWVTSEEPVDLSARDWWMRIDNTPVEINIVPEDGLITRLSRIGSFLASVEDRRTILEAIDALKDLTKERVREIAREGIDG